MFPFPKHINVKFTTYSNSKSNDFTVLELMSKDSKKSIVIPKNSNSYFDSNSHIFYSDSSFLFCTRLC